ncbi:MAG TPA: SigE family RNA polymerase sigma factor [Actinomycetes bacterium]|nr:SigE family RNA polymerase sigma factor [Actinomycetes bacterium]
MIPVDDEGKVSFDVWVRAAQSGLLQSAFLMTGDAYHAQDLVQDALVKVAARWEKLRDENPDGYARRILYRDHVSWWRRSRDVPVAVLIEGSPRDLSESSVDYVVVGTALDRLTRKQRAVLVLRYFDDLTEKQTADILGVSVGTVKSQCSAALTRLRKFAPELSAFKSGGGSDV